MSTVFDDLDRATLAVLCREYLLCGHLIDRAAMPLVLQAFGMEAMRDVAIDEWMGASPVYTRRMRALLEIEGDDVATIFKGMQLDIGAPPQFMDFRYEVTDAHHGEFALASCGALLDVEPYGEPFVVTMCHHIEDPTFDATAAATNPRARMRPIHRPPRVPAGRVPFCLWSVVIDESAEPLPMPEGAERLLTSRAAATILDTAAGPDAEGATDYAGPLVPDIRFEEFSRNTLIALAQEICLQGHLLTLTFTDALERRFGADAVPEIARKRMAGVAGIAARRLKRALGLGDGRDDLVRVLRLHPAFHPHAYVAVDVADDLSVSLRDCPALGDRPGLSWADSLDATALEAIAQEFDPTARVATTGDRSWRIELGASSEPSPEIGEVKLTSLSTGAAFAFEDR
ncbi:MAG: hypothetical protein WAT66_16970 [Actinomycetota bacterium]